MPGLRILVTGGAGFIGSNFVRFALGGKLASRLVNLDKLTYAGNLSNLKGVEEGDAYSFVKGDIADAGAVDGLFAEERFDAVFNFAAESHVDRSIENAAEFARTNVVGTQVLLDAAVRRGVRRFVQIGTDEVYGSIPRGSFTESSSLNPRSPYSATKAAADLLALAYHSTHGLDAVVTRSTNNFGPCQYPEKLIPLLVTNALRGKRLPVYGDGSNVRDWLHVEDNCRGIWAVFEKGAAGEVYNLGGGNELPNLEVARRIAGETGVGGKAIEFVADRKGHDFRYSVDCSKARALGWSPRQEFATALSATVSWYEGNSWWWKPLVR